jgi:hypothetical protein
MRNTLYKAYLDDFAKFCQSLGGTTSEVMGALLAFEVRCIVGNAAASNINSSLPHISYMAVCQKLSHFSMVLEGLYGWVVRAVNCLHASSLNAYHALPALDTCSYSQHPFSITTRPYAPQTDRRALNITLNSTCQFCTRHFLYSQRPSPHIHTYPRRTGGHSISR